MKMQKTITFVSLLTLSHLAMASGTHGGGHGMHDMDHSKMNMGGGSDAAHWMAPAHEAARENPIKATKGSIKRGAKTFQQVCASCHGKTAEGDGMAGMMLNPKPANLRVMAGGHPDGDFFYKISNGRGSMPAWKGSLSENQRWDLVNYVQSLANEPKKEESGGHGEPGHGH